ncbi:glycosyltransferase family 4 protein [Roseomonas sp. BN140053]|uniref:glycosyltransferase family 4 protein n=1 Tax=Roseomonas sp. BN140053 TaxID=3391898 RepID=UPI0039E85B50
MRDSDPVAPPLSPLAPASPVASAPVPSASGPASLAPSLLMDLRPCYEGFAGIPQEARLLFAMFSGFRLRRFGGLASGIHYSSRRPKMRTPYERVLAQTQVLISQDTKRTHWLPGFASLPNAIKRRIFRPYLALTEIFRRERLDLKIDPETFEDFLWVKLFDRTLAPHERPLVQKAEYFATELGHEYARSLSLLPRVFQRQVDTQGWDVFFAATVSPYRVSPGTAAIIRYYDALPLLSPHTVGEPWPHALSHGRMLQRNMEDGATFFCDSEPVRGDLLRIFPGAEKRVHTIPVVLAPEYRPDVRPQHELRTILRRRASSVTASSRRPGPEPAQLPRLIMAVSTLEPRKNYLKLFRGFEIAKQMTAQPMQLLVVANPGWRSEAELTELKALVREGAYHLAGVPQAELRTLYSMAHLVVAPSRAEGFDYSGAEAMACGTPVLASDIPVHRWVYGDAAEYFDGYDEEALARSLARLVELPREDGHLAALRDRGLRQAALYRPESLMPRWEEAIRKVAENRLVTSFEASRGGA